MFSTRADPYELEGHTLDVRRHARAKRMRLVIDPRTGQLRLTLPPRASLASGLKWAREQSDWVVRQTEKLVAPQPITPGMKLNVAGEALLLEWDVQHSRVPKRRDGRLCVGGDEVGLSGRVLRWLQREALVVLTAETSQIAASAQIIVGRVGIGDPRGRWGSCSSKGDIRYNWRLILAPSDVRHATVAHEVAHRVHMNHSAQFHALVAVLHGSDPTPARAWLRMHGTNLHQIGRG